MEKFAVCKRAKHHNFFRLKLVAQKLRTSSGNLPSPFKAFIQLLALSLLSFFITGSVFSHLFGRDI